MQPFIRILLAILSVLGAAFGAIMLVAQYHPDQWYLPRLLGMGGWITVALAVAAWLTAILWQK